MYYEKDDDKLGKINLKKVIYKYNIFWKASFDSWATKARRGLIFKPELVERGLFHSI